MALLGVGADVLLVVAHHLLHHLYLLLRINLVHHFLRRCGVLCRRHRFHLGLIVGSARRLHLLHLLEHLEHFEHLFLIHASLAFFNS